MSDRLVERVMRWYNSLAESYDELYGEEQATKHRLLLQELGEPRGRILDAGAGSMLLERLLLEEGPRHDLWLVALDVSNMLTKAYAMLRASPLIDAVLGDIFNTPFRPFTFDGVYSITVLGGYGDEALKAVRLMSELLRERGLMVLTLHEKTVGPREVKTLQMLCERVFRVHVDLACLARRPG